MPDRHDTVAQLRADAEINLLAALRAARGMGDEFFAYLITMALEHLERPEIDVALNAPENG